MSTNENILKPRTDFDDCYVYGDEIGKGRYATVKKCYCKKTDKCYAAKVIKNFRAKHAKLNLNIVENEITALSIARSHPSIINLYEIFHHKGETILVLEYATEKDLHIYLDSEGAFEEKKACEIIFQLLKAIEFLHSKNVLHLDIKPENVLLMNPISPKSAQNENNNVIKEVSSNDVIKVKLCDFSFSQVMKPGKTILGMMGTAAYSAPEILQYEELTKATDMWSLGVLTHVILTEYTPFGNGTEENNQTQTNILSVKEKDFECIEDYFDNISQPAKNFIESLLKYKSKQRLTIEQAINHEWFKMLEDSNKNTKETNFTESTKTSEISVPITTPPSVNPLPTSTVRTASTPVLIEVNHQVGVKTAEIITTNPEIKPLRDDKNNNNLPNETFEKINDKKNEVKCEIKIKEQISSSSSSSSSTSNESIKSSSHHHAINSASKLISNNLRSNKSASLLTPPATVSLSAKMGQVKLLKSANKSSSSIIDHHHLHSRFEAGGLCVSTSNNNTNINEKSLIPTPMAASSKVNQITSKITTKVANRFI